MIGLHLSRCVHKKRVKWGINNILLPLVFSTYSYILYFVILSVFLKFSTPSQNVEFNILCSHMEIGYLRRLNFLQALHISMQND